VALAPLWLLERSITMSIALAYRLRGGIPYAGNRMPRAASTLAQLHRRAATSP
jgi:hypothetical protein